MSWRMQDLARVVAASGDLLATRRMAAMELGGPATAGDVAVYRVLGARQAVQAVVSATTGLRALGAVVDAAHIATMLPVAALVPRWRRAALVQIAFAAVMLVSELATD